MSVLKPRIPSDSENDGQMEEKFNSHHGTKWKEFAVKDEIFYQRKSNLDQWIWVPGIVKARIGDVVYVLYIETTNGHRTVKAHDNQIKLRYLTNERMLIMNHLLCTTKSTIKNIKFMQKRNSVTLQGVIEE